MSGGHFYQKEVGILLVSDSILKAISDNDTMDGYGFEPETIRLLTDCVAALHTAYAYTELADKLLSGNLGEENYRKRVMETKVNREKLQNLTS